MPIGATVGGAVAGVAGSAISGSASKSAANQENQAAQQASANQMQMYQQTRTDLQPYNQTGQGQLVSLGNLANQYNLGAGTSDPTWGINSSRDSLGWSGTDLGAAQGSYQMALGQLGQSPQYQAAAQNNINQAGYLTSVQGGTVNSAVQELGAQNSLIGQGGNAFDQQSATVGNALGTFGQQAATTAQAGNALAQAGVDAGNARAGNALLSGGISQATLDNTPGYQFTKQQGLESVQNSAAARGLGTSGAAEKAAASYATGLADQTYQNQANIINQSVQNSNALAGTDLNTASGRLAQAAQYGSTGENQLAGAAQYGATGQNRLASANQVAIGSNALVNAANAYGNTATSYLGQAQANQNQLAGNINFGNALAGVGNDYTSTAGAYQNQAAGQIGYNSAAQGNIQNDYNRLLSISQLGENAAAQTGNYGAQLANQAGQFSTSGAAASAAGTVGQANALAGGFNNLSSTPLTYQFYKNLLAGQQNGSGYSTPQAGGLY